MQTKTKRKRTQRTKIKARKRIRPPNEPYSNTTAKQQQSPLSELEQRIINEEQCINEQRTRELEDDDGTFHIHTSEKYDETAIHDEYKLIDTIQNNTKQLH